MGKKTKVLREGGEIVVPYARGKITTPNGEYEFYYPKGVRWGCKRCGACCRDASHRPRRVLLLPSDVSRLAEAGEDGFKLDVKGEAPFVGEMKKVGGACIYLTEEGCRVYPHRALLCRTYPFWIERDGRSFEIMYDARCIGFGHGGGLGEDFFRDLVEQALEQRGDA
ncbi:MAG: YkgJ family cysteine cluster protein [Candidatus Bathyarchaeota archaeon]|nr:YkgJ family cysteine cluster protein [Candidatus Bathyarchaeota archaeon]